jgi:oligopeptide/dipeptide ABC transporter ATP-binding protein
VPIVGELPSPLNPPSGCAFHQRCAFVRERCKSERPILSALAPLQEEARHEAACHFPLESHAHDR